MAVRPLGTNAIKLVFKCTMYTSQTASFGFWYDSKATVPSTAGLATLLGGGGAWATAATTLITALKAIMSPQCSYTSLQAFGYTADGTLVAEAVGGSVVAGTGSNNLPAQLALVVTTQTASFGRSFHGRAYIPANGLPGGTNGQLTAAQIGPVNSAVATFLSGTSAGSGPLAGVASFSKVRITPINAVRTDSLIDTQRRRRDKLVAGATATAAVAPID